MKTKTQFQIVVQDSRGTYRSQRDLFDSLQDAEREYDSNLNLQFKGEGFNMWIEKIESSIIPHTIFFQENKHKKPF